MQSASRFPWSALLAMASAGFLTILTEALPAGLLPQIGAGLGISEAWAGQWITAYAFGSLLAAIPLVSATQSWRRRPLLLSAIGGFAIVNLATAISPFYGLTLVARFLAGVSAGLVWALLAVFFYVLAHNLLYTYIAPFLQLADLQAQTSAVLLAFGLASLVSIAIAGAKVDGHLRLLLRVSVWLFLLAAIALGLAPASASLVVGAVLIWGLAFGGAATLLQTALVRAAGSAADLAQSMLVTAWNLAIAGGGLAGAALLEQGGAQSLPWGAALLLLLALLCVSGRARAQRMNCVT